MDRPFSVSSVLTFLETVDLRSCQFYTSTQEREQEKRIRIEAGPFAELPGLFHVLLRPHAVAAIQVDRGETVVAREDQLRLPNPLSQRERLAIRVVGLLELAAALMDLRDHDERNREVVQLPQLAVERGGRLRRLKAFCFAVIRECTVRRRQVRVDI